MTRVSNSSQQVLDAVTDLTNTGRQAHRLVVAEITGLKLTIVDDTLKRMTSDGRLKRVERGVYVPVPPPKEDRSITNTMLPDGTCKIEIGEDVLSLSLREARHLAMLIGGIPLVFSASAGR